MIPGVDWGDIVLSLVVVWGVLYLAHKISNINVTLDLRLDDEREDT